MLETMFDKKTLLVWTWREIIISLASSVVVAHHFEKKNEYGALIDKNGTKDLCNTMTNY